MKLTLPLALGGVAETAVEGEEPGLGGQPGDVETLLVLGSVDHR